MGPLAGVRIVEIAGIGPGPFAAMMLADMGADVILVEPPGGAAERHHPPFLNDAPGPDRSLWWWHYHASKRSVEIDLGAPAGRERLLALIDQADVLIEAEPTRRLADLGLDWPDLATRRPTRARHRHPAARSACRG